VNAGGAVQPLVNIYWTDSSYITGGSSPDAVGLIPGGFVANAAIGQRFFQQTSVNIQLNTNPSLVATCNFYSGYVYIDPYASRHPMNVGWITHSGTSGGDEGCSGVDIGTFNTSWSDANYGMTLQGTPQTTNVRAYVGDGRGREYSEDSNGNCCGAQGTTVVSGGQISSVSVPGIAGSVSFGYATQTKSYTPASSLVAGSSSSSGCPSSFPPAPTSLLVLKTIGLPNQTSYTFGYDSQYGLINNIVYPTGASVSYNWQVNANSESLEFGGGSYMTPICWYTHDWPAVQSRIVRFDGVHQALEQDFSYSTQWGTGASANQWTKKITTITTKDCTRASSCASAPSFQTIYTYLPAPVCCSAFAGQSPIESSIVYKDWNGIVLETVTKNWEMDFPPQLLSECVTLPTGVTSGKFYAYAAYGVVSDIKEYDYNILSSGACAQGASPPTATPTRETVVTYQSFPAMPFAAETMLDRPSTVKINDHGILKAETDYAYDSYGSGLTPVTAVGHDDTNFPASYTNRGNVTSKTLSALVVQVPV
jgi:hypothetical protein